MYLSSGENLAGCTDFVSPYILDIYFLMYNDYTLSIFVIEISF